jgi:hypothetical protein
MTKAPTTITYMSVVSCETVHIALLLAALNDLNVKVGDVLNDYITAPITKNVWTVLEPESGNNSSKSAIVVRALYGLKSAGAAFHAHLASLMHQMGYMSCKADPDRTDDNFRYFTYILCHVDDILCVHHDPMTVLNMINGYMPLKPSLVGDPDIYLGTKLKPTQLENGIWAWGLSPSKYVAQAVKNCEKHLADKMNSHFQLPQCADNPFPYNYCPDLVLSDSLNPECSSFYQHLIGVMMRMVELGCVDILTEVYLLLSHLAYTCKGHLETALHMMAYLQQKHNTQLVF